MLAKGNEVKFEQGGMTMKVHVPDEVQLKVELEVETDIFKNKKEKKKK